MPPDRDHGVIPSTGWISFIPRLRSGKRVGRDPSSPLSFPRSSNREPAPDAMDGIRGRLSELGLASTGRGRPDGRDRNLARGGGRQMSDPVEIAEPPVASASSGSGQVAGLSGTRSRLSRADETRSGRQSESEQRHSRPCASFRVGGPRSRPPVRGSGAAERSQFAQIGRLRLGFSCRARDQCSKTARTRRLRASARSLLAQPGSHVAPSAKLSVAPQAAQRASPMGSPPRSCPTSKLRPGTTVASRYWQRAVSRPSTRGLSSSRHQGRSCRQRWDPPSSPEPIAQAAADVAEQVRGRLSDFSNRAKASADGRTSSGCRKISYRREPLSTGHHPAVNRAPEQN